jgi:hypothetical protein
MSLETARCKREILVTQCLDHGIRAKMTTKPREGKRSKCTTLGAMRRKLTKAGVIPQVSA